MVRGLLENYSGRQCVRQLGDADCVGQPDFQALDGPQEMLK